jgi:hypothetical protein
MPITKRQRLKLLHALIYFSENTVWAGKVNGDSVEFTIEPNLDDSLEGALIKELRRRLRED